MKSFVEMNPRLISQSLYDISSTKKHLLGTRWDLADGRKFIYAKNGAVALLAGVAVQAEAPDAAHDELTISYTTAVKAATDVIITLGASAVLANAYAEGYLRLNKGTLQGGLYKIKSHAANAGSLALTLKLYDELRVTLTDEEGSLVKHPCKDVIVHPAPNTTVIVGVTLCAVTANYYAWLQVKGPAAVLMEGTPVIGQGLKPSATTDGALTVKAEADTVEQLCGQCIQVPTSTEVGMAMLDIAGW